MGESNVASNRSAGRPAIEDALIVYLFVEVGRRKRGMKVYPFTTDKGTAFSGDLFDTGATFRYPLRGESLRRRYTKSRLEIGAAKVRYSGLIVDQPDVDLAKDTLERIIGDLLAN